MRKEMLMEAEIPELYAGLCREAARCELHALRAVKDKRPELVPLFRSLGQSLTMQANQRKNASLYRQVENDKRTTGYHVCDFCCYVSLDTSPEHCPICTAPKQRFIRVSVL